MTDTNNVVIEQLRAIRATLDEHSLRFRSIETRLIAIEHHMAGLITSFGGQQSDIDSLRRRIERIEKRLELSE